MESDKKRDLVKLFESFRELKRPTGYVNICEDLDVDIDEYDGYISGLIKSFLSGATIEQEKIDLGIDIELKLKNCEMKLQELRDFWMLQRRLAELLVDVLLNK